SAPGGDSQHHVWPRRNLQKRQCEKESHKRFDERHPGRVRKHISAMLPPFDAGKKRTLYFNHHRFE
ncbi:hypothetical protein KV198_22505, partial [Klebsiella pneumoniae]|nr:hypothetical protein [Klebsiella pneumoniae]